MGSARRVAMCGCGLYLAMNAVCHNGGQAAWEAFTGNESEAKKNAAALNLSNTRDVEYAAAFALSLKQPHSRAQTLANDLATRFPQDTLVKFTYVPLLNAIASWHRRQPVLRRSAHLK